MKTRPGVVFHITVDSLNTHFKHRRYLEKSETERIRLTCVLEYLWDTVK